jgi:hypothetical protein
MFSGLLRHLYGGPLDICKRRGDGREHPVILTCNAWGGLGTQATDRPVAVRAAGRCTGRRRFASGTMIGGR